MKEQFYLVASISLFIAALALAYFLVIIQPGKTQSNFDSCFNRCVNVGVPPVGGKCEDGRVTGSLKEDVGSDFKKGDTWCYTSEGYCFSTCNK